MLGDAKSSTPLPQSPSTTPLAEDSAGKCEAAFAATKPGVNPEVNPLKSPSEHLNLSSSSTDASSDPDKDPVSATQIPQKPLVPNPECGNSLLDPSSPLPCPDTNNINNGTSSNAGSIEPKEEDDLDTTVLAAIYLKNQTADWYNEPNGIKEAIERDGKVQLFMDLFEEPITGYYQYPDYQERRKKLGFCLADRQQPLECFKYTFANVLNKAPDEEDYHLKYWLHVDAVANEKMDFHLEIRCPLDSNALKPLVKPFAAHELNKAYEANNYKPFRMLKIKYAYQEWIDELGTEDTRPSFKDMKIPGTFDVSMANQPAPPFMLKLYDYQRRTLNWMENIEDGIDSEYYYPGVVKTDGDDYFVLHQVHQNSAGFLKAFDEVKASHPTIRSGIIADKPGVGKTITTLALCQTRPCQEPNYLYKMHPVHNKFLSRATIIFVPNNISSQWMTEITKCYGTKINAIEIKGKRSYEAISLKQVLECDIVIVSYNFLANNNYIANRITSPNRLLQKHAPGKNFEDEAVAKEFVDSCPLGKFAFSWIHFHRVVYDEFHELDEKKNAIKTQLDLMTGTTMWGLTGTPKVDDESTVSHFASYLKIKPAETDYYIESRFKTLFWKRFLLSRIRRNEPEVHYPPPEYETIRVVQTAMEHTLYKSSVGSKKEMENLVKLCNHYQIGNNLNPESGSDALTIEQVTERVQKDREVKIKRLTKHIAQQVFVIESRRKYLTETAFQMVDTRRMAEQALRKAIKDDNDMKEDLRSTQSQFNFFQNFLNSYMAEDNKIFCSVCWSDDIPRDDLALVPCGHVFCWECAEGVADRNMKCPQCMAPISRDQLMKLKPPAAVVEAPENADVDHDEDKLDPNKFGSKIHELVQYLQREMAACDSHRFIVFIQWSDLADLVTQALNTFGIATARLKSGWAQREGALKRFRAGLSTPSIVNDTDGSGDVGSSSSSSSLDGASPLVEMEEADGKAKAVKGTRKKKQPSLPAAAASETAHVELPIGAKRKRKPIMVIRDDDDSETDVGATRKNEDSDFEPVLADNLEDVEVATAVVVNDTKGKRKAVFEEPPAKRVTRGRSKKTEFVDSDSEFESDGDLGDMDLEAEGLEEEMKKVKVKTKKDVKGKGKAVQLEEPPVKIKTKAVKVLMLSAKDSVSGLNLTEATHCIILHPFHDAKEEYAIGAEKQGVARTLRNGQTKTVKIVRFVVDHTVEQEMHERRVDKLRD
ncbi:SNF2 family N-terminal domain-containing protein [Obelidium mucronatum]|nr:SNF2 family N-terminal domain-containing protein [Obelidium mucronatum]